MSGVIKIDISESPEELFVLLQKQKTAKTQQRVQILYWLKTQQATTTHELAALVGRHRTTISRWLSQYRKEGLNSLLTIKKSPGRTRSIPKKLQNLIESELTDPEGFSSYKEVQHWLEVIHNLEIDYTVVHQFIRYHLQAKLKVPRPVHTKQDTEATEEFKKKLPQQIETQLKEHHQRLKSYRRVRYWLGDESRLGLITLPARKITQRGVQPVGIEQWCFDYLWLYGLVEPLTGESCFREFSHVDSLCFEYFLQEFSQQEPLDLHILQLDNGPLHTKVDLVVPDNVILLFQPPYSPQVNPIERLWKEIKKHLKWKLFDSLDELRASLTKILDKLTPQEIESVTGWNFIREALSVANI